MNQLNGAIAPQYQCAPGQFSPLPEPIINEVMGIMGQFRVSYQAVLEGIPDKQKVVEVVIERLSNQLMVFFQKPGVTLDQMEQYLAILDRTITMIRTQHYGWIVDMINAANQAAEGEVNAIKGVLDGLIDHHRHWVENRANIHIMLNPGRLLTDLMLEQNNAELIEHAISGNAKGVQKCLLNGADVNYRNVTCNSSLHLACNYGHADVVKVLIKQPEINLNIQDDGANTPLHRAARAGYFAIIKLLLDAGASPQANNINGLNFLNHTNYTAYLKWKRNRIGF